MRQRHNLDMKGHIISYNELTKQREDLFVINRKNPLLTKGVTATKNVMQIKIYIW